MAKFISPTLLSVLLILSPSTTNLVSSANVDIYGPQTAFTSRYWDCCKPSCAWADKASFVSKKPVLACDNNNNPILDAQVGTGCNGGTAFSCANQSPWAINSSFSYGFVGAYLKHGNEGDWCCSCYELEFLDGDVKGQKMVVQASNTDYEMTDQNIFTFGIPAGNTSYAKACGIQYGIDNSVFGQELIGVSNRSQCDSLPKAMIDGCHWRFDWFKDAKAPKVSYKRTECPAALTDITGCRRTDESTFQAVANGSKSDASRPQTPGSGTVASSVFISSALVALLASWAL